MALHIAVGERTGRHHLGVEQGVTREQAVKKPAVAIGPIHHRRNTESPPAQWLIYIDFIFWQVLHLGRF
jgi:hypothetical protein